jgi:hypothetical protein
VFARAAELLDLEFLGLRALVLVGHVVVALAVLAGELDEVSHRGRSVWHPHTRMPQKVREV